MLETWITSQSKRHATPPKSGPYSTHSTDSAAAWPPSRCLTSDHTTLARVEQLADACLGTGQLAGGVADASRDYGSLVGIVERRQAPAVLVNVVLDRIIATGLAGLETELRAQGADSTTVASNVRTVAEAQAAGPTQNRG